MVNSQCRITPYLSVDRSPSIAKREILSNLAYSIPLVGKQPMNRQLGAIRPLVLIFRHVASVYHLLNGPPRDPQEAGRQTLDLQKAMLRIAALDLPILSNQKINRITH